MPKNAARRTRLAEQQQATIEELQAKVAELAARNNPGNQAGDLHRCDWICGGDRCQYLNYGNLSRCRRCGSPRFPDGVSLHGQFRRQAVQPQAQRAPQAPSFRVHVPRNQGGAQSTGWQPGPLRHGHMRHLQSVALNGTSSTSFPAATQRAGGRNVLAPKGDSSWADVARRAPHTVPLPVGPQHQQAPHGREARQQSPADRDAGALHTPGLERNKRGVDPPPPEKDDGTDAASQISEDELQEEQSPKAIQSEIRKFEFRVERRKDKLRKQQEALEEHTAFLEEQRRRLATMQYEVDETKEEIRDMDSKIVTLSTLHAELVAARASARSGPEPRGQAGDDEDEQAAAETLDQVFQAMQNFGAIRSPLIRGMLATFVQQLQAMQAQYSPVGGPPAPTPARSPPPRSPSPRVQPGSEPQAGAGLPPTPLAPQQGPAPSTPTIAMVQAAEKALKSDVMWEDSNHGAETEQSAGAIEKTYGKSLAASAKGPATQSGRQRLLAICDRTAPYARGRSASKSPARSRDRKELLSTLQQKIDEQRNMLC